MRIYYYFQCILVSIVFSFTGKAQYNQWTWKHGSALNYDPGVHGPIGVPSVLNNPHSTYGGVGWTDSQGRFWLYGGISGQATSTQSNEVMPAVMWMYEPNNDTWTWMQGDYNTYSPPTNVGVGVSSPLNTPGGRGFGARSWVDKNNNLWLFGGGCPLDPDFYTYLEVINDLWMFNTTTLEWTFWGGYTPSNPVAPFYGVKGVPSINNWPPAHEESNPGWVDNNGNLWFLGGSYNDYYNHLWKYDVVTHEWTWMNGTNLPNQNAVGVMGAGPNAAYTPAGLSYIYNAWQDPSGRFWLTGGTRYVGGAGGWESYNDVWSFDPSTNMWEWVKGNGLPNNAGVFGQKCTPANINESPAEALLEARCMWTDDCGNFWAYASTRTNSMFLYSIKNNTWQWVSGSGNYNNNVDYAPVYGSINIPAAANHPGYRIGSTAYKRKGKNELYFLGGTGWPVGSNNYNEGAIKNDLWLFTPDKPTAAFTTSVSATCLPVTVNFTSQSTPGCNEIKSFNWNFGDAASGANNTSTFENPTHVYSAAGNYTIKLLVTNCTGSKDSISHQINIANPYTFSISAAVSNVSCNGLNDGSILINNGNGTLPLVYSWSNGSTQSSVSNLSSSVYSVSLTDANNCKLDTSFAVNQPSVFSVVLDSLKNVDCFSNAAGYIAILLNGGTAPYTYQWSNLTGASINSNLVAGIYSVSVSDVNNCVLDTAFTITEPSAIVLSKTITPSSCGAQDGAIQTSISGGTGPYYYLWNTGSFNPSISNLNGGNFIIQVADANSCLYTETITVGASNVINVTIIAPQQTCENVLVTFSANATGGNNNYSYAWSNGLPNTSGVSVNAPSNTIYTVTVTDSQNCSGVATHSLTVYQNPTAIVVEQNMVGCAPHCINLINNSVNYITTNWIFSNGTNDQATNSNQCFNSYGIYTYSLVVTNQYNCSDTLVGLNPIVVNPMPEAGFTASPNPTTINEPLIYFTDQSTGTAQYFWNFGDVNSIDNFSNVAGNNTHQYSDTGTYCVQLKLTNDFGCMDSTSNCVLIDSDISLYVPNSFTPNGDGRNQFFYPYGVGISTIQMSIFNRWGELVYDTGLVPFIDESNGWNGKVQNQLSEVGIDSYVWVIKMKDTNGKKHSYIGHLNLLR